MQVLCSSVVIAGLVQLPLTNVHTRTSVCIHTHAYTHTITLDREFLMFNVKQKE